MHPSILTRKGSHEVKFPTLEIRSLPRENCTLDPYQHNPLDVDEHTPVDLPSLAGIFHESSSANRLLRESSVAQPSGGVFPAFAGDPARHLFLVPGRTPLLRTNVCMSTIRFGNSTVGKPSHPADWSAACRTGFLCFNEKPPPNRCSKSRHPKGLVALQPFRA
jgi:hypothetical protein